MLGNDRWIRLYPHINCNGVILSFDGASTRGNDHNRRQRGVFVRGDINSPQIGFTLEAYSVGAGSRGGVSVSGGDAVCLE